MATSFSHASGSDLGCDADNNLTLPECFDFVFKLHEEFETTNESTSSDHLQKRLRDGILLCEKAIRIVNELELFSRNEDIDEVSTNEIKYMLLSAFLAYLTGLNTHLPRRVAVNKSKLCYLDFLKLLKSYDVIEYAVLHSDDDDESENTAMVVKQPSSQNSDLSLQAAQRNNKIQRFKEKKAYEKKLTDMKVYMDKEHVDDEVKREFYLTLLKHWASKAVDEIDSCNLELQMLKHREEMAKNGHGSRPNMSSNNETKKPKPFRPFILTKTQIQKQVFGLGYPAMPTMTVDEFYEQKLKEGTLSESVQGHSMQNWAQNPEQDALDIEREDAEKELNAERDDPEALERARAMDDWKDDHRRGEGNRYNKG